ncbi:hypothetical protein D9M70_550960 [compost metagenome]
MVLIGQLWRIQLGFGIGLPSQEPFALTVSISVFAAQSSFFRLKSFFELSYRSEIDFKLGDVRGGNTQ